jgi:hypothetical protein
VHSAIEGNGPQQPGSASRVLRIAVFALGLCACTAGVEAHAVYGFPVVEAQVVPAEIEYYPRTYYRGRYAYLIEDRWYYPTERGWVVFREEPRELSRYRVWYGQHYHTYPPYSPKRYYRHPELGAPPPRRPPPGYRVYPR